MHSGFRVSTNICSRGRAIMLFIYSKRLCSSADPLLSRGIVFAIARVQRGAAHLNAFCFFAPAPAPFNYFGAINHPRKRSDAAERKKAGKKKDAPAARTNGKIKRVQFNAVLVIFSPKERRAARPAPTEGGESGPRGEDSSARSAVPFIRG